MKNERSNNGIEAAGIKILGALVVFVGIILLISKLFSFEQIAFISAKQYAGRLYLLTQQHQVLASLLFFLVFVLCTVFFIPVTVALSIVAGFLFGTMWGTVLVTMAVTIGSLIVVQMVRMLYAERFKQQYPNQIESFDKEMKQYGGLYIVGLHLLPFSPTFLINIAAGALAVPAWTFAWATALGTMPGTFMYAFAGKSLHRLPTLHGIIGMWALLGMTVMGIVVLASRFFLPTTNFSSTQSKSQ